MNKEYTEEDYKTDMQEYWKEERLQLKKDKRCLNKQKKKLSQQRLNGLEELFYQYENSCNYGVVQEHKGTKEKECRSRYHYFNEGVCTQGISGDYSGSGTVWYPIGNGNYFKFDYWG